MNTPELLPPIEFELHEQIKDLTDENLINEIKLEYEAKKYQRLRREEYPSITDQLDDLFHAGLFSEEMSAKIQAVKDKYPKA